MYSPEEVQFVLEEYKRQGSVSKTIQVLGYPTRSTLYSWINQVKMGHLPNSKREYKNKNQFPMASVSVKMQALKRCFEKGESVSKVAAEIGYTRATIYNWRKPYLSEGEIGLMSKKTDSIPREELKPASKDDVNSNEEIKALKEQIKALQMQVDILSEAMNILKKDQGMNLKGLKNKEKIELVHALKTKYDCRTLCEELSLPKSSYYDHLSKAKENTRKNEDLKEAIKSIFEESKHTYGYRRIWRSLKNKGITVSEKVIRRIQKELGLNVNCKKKRKYSSYAGEITPAPDNILNRDFSARKPNEKWVSDITEFAIPAGKIYLSPVIDCWDGCVISWTSSETPNAKLTNSSLLKACASLHDDDHPIVHTDRGAHYRWPSWIAITQKYNLIRSMSEKGCSPDNAACEGFFGRFKNEFFYGRNFQGYSLNDFKQYLDDCLNWYNNVRIKNSYGCSIKEHRETIVG